MFGQLALVTKRNEGSSECEQTIVSACIKLKGTSATVTKHHIVKYSKMAASINYQFQL